MGGCAPLQPVCVTLHLDIPVIPLTPPPPSHRRPTEPPPAIDVHFTVGLLSRKEGVVPRGPRPIKGARGAVCGRRVDSDPITCDMAF